MEYEIESWKINDLLNLYSSGKLNLNPPYQRGDIWSLPAKKKLIDSIKSKYPLPSFFIYKKSENDYEMVDGQQRTRTIIGFTKGLFPDSNNVKIEESDQDFILNKYKIPVILITQVNEDEPIEDFYYRVNKFGTKLNRPEILKAQYFGSPVQNLIEKLADSPEFSHLQLFSKSAESRLQDLDFIGELLALIKYGITDKKIYSDKLYEDEDFALEYADEIEKKFLDVLRVFTKLNAIHPLKSTRYSQRNDFYTYFNFLLFNPSLEDGLLTTQYNLLVNIGKDISPSSDCYSFQEYALNCVSQSNSKHAREARLGFFNQLLLNESSNPLNKIDADNFANNSVADTLIFYELDEKSLLNIDKYFIVNPDKIK